MVTDLKSITDVIGDGLHGTPEYDDNGQFFFINGNNLNETIEIKSDTKRVNEEEYNKYKKPLNSNTILLSINGTLGNFARYNNEPVILGKSACYINIKQGYNVDYISWFLKSKVKSDFERNATGTTIKNISLKQIREFEINLPDDIVQEKIAKTLNSIQAKIDVNNKINRNLYDLLTLMYKCDYIEKINDHPEWKEVTMDDITSKFATGLNPRKNFVLGYGNNYYVTIKNMGNNRIYLDSKCDMVDDEALIKINKRSDLRVGDLLFSGIGTIGRVHLIDEHPNNWNVSESVFTMRPNASVSSEFLYLLLLSYDMQDYAISLASGSVQKGIRMAELKKYKLFLPTAGDMERITSTWKPMIDQIKENEKENDKLAILRDTLLPKLMSGELDVSDLDI